MTNEFKSIISNKILRCLLFVTLLFFIICGSSCYFYDDSRKAKYPKTSEVAEVEIKKICEELVLPDDFKKIRDEVAYTYNDRATIGSGVSSDLDFDEVNSFFVERLSKKTGHYTIELPLMETLFILALKRAYELN